MALHLLQLLAYSLAMVSPVSRSLKQIVDHINCFLLPVLHPNGNVAEFLVAAGLARVVDWHAGMLAANGGMERLRSAERNAKEKRLFLFASLPTSVGSRSGAAGASVANGSPKDYEAIVVRVWSGDQLSVVPKSGGKERRIQLSSTRAPKYVLFFHESAQTMTSNLIIELRIQNKLTTPTRLVRCWNPKILENATD